MPQSKNETIVVVGFGWVGQANALALSRMGYVVNYYDVVSPRLHYAEKYQSVYQEIKPLETIREVDSPGTWYIVCIGDRVNEHGQQDISLIASALDSLRGAQGKVILRSTVLPTLLETLPFAIYLPEFLHEIRAVEECLNPYYFVVGRREEIALPSFLQAWQTRAYKVFFGNPAEAAYIKYLSNIWNAVRIAFVNEFGNSIALPTSIAARKATERIIDFIFEKKSYLRYGQAFGGHCLPKDLRAFIGMNKNRIPVPFLQGVLEANHYHEQVVEKYQTLTQWFSTWDYQYFSSGAVSLFYRWWQWLNTAKPVRSLRRVTKPIILGVEQNLPRVSAQGNKEHWERLAKENPYFYAHPDTKSREKVDEFEIRETGEADYQFYINQDKILQPLANSSLSKRVLEVGSGVGRMTEFFAKNFSEVYAFDISKTMLAIAKKRLDQHKNIVWLEGNNEHIPVEDGTLDFIFSYDVFKYVPNLAIIKSYVAEMSRIIKPGGLVKFQVRAGPPIHRWRWFRGVSTTPEEMRILLETNALEVLGLDYENPKSLWVWARKNL